MRRTFRSSLVTLLCLGVISHVGLAQLEVLSPSVLERSAAPGGTYTIAIALRNAASTAQSARVYQEDYSFFADGRTLFERASSHARSNAAWITVPALQIVVEPGQTVSVTLSVTVPNDSVRRVGSYWSLILIEPIAAPSRASDTAQPAWPQGTSAIVTRVRHAIQIATHIAETGRHDVRIGEPRLVVSGAGRRGVRVEIENIGERAYRPQVSLEILAADGRTVLSHTQARGLIYPGTSIDQVFDLPSLGSDDYVLLLLVDTGGADIFGARYRLRL